MHKINVLLKIISLGVLLYKQFDELSFHDGRARCDQDSEDASVSGFLHMPMPRSETENQMYFDLVKARPLNTYLDITEIYPQTSPRSWELSDGSTATFFSWYPNEPNDLNTEPFAQLLRDHGTEPTRSAGLWNDVGNNGDHLANIVCSYFLPAGAENSCPWLSDFQDSLNA